MIALACSSSMRWSSTKRCYMDSADVDPEPRSRPLCRTRDASGSGRRLPRRHGQNERGLVVGRKNWMFYGSDMHAEAAAAIFSVIASCAAISHTSHGETPRRSSRGAGASRRRTPWPRGHGASVADDAPRPVAGALACGSRAGVQHRPHGCAGQRFGPAPLAAGSTPLYDVPGPCASAFRLASSVLSR